MINKKKLDTILLHHIMLITWVFSIVGGLAILYIFGVLD
jgi:hypothetical protein